MTNATFAETNDTENDKISNRGRPCDGVKLCNETKILENIIEQKTLQLQATNNTASINNIDTSIPSNNTEKKEPLKNKITDPNTVLKYVYKNNDKIELDVKEKGHFKNQLKRRRRSTEHPFSPLPSKFQTPALIVDYETSHEPTAAVNWSPPLNSANIIKKDDRADFNIVSRHNNVKDNDKNLNVPIRIESSEAADLNEGSYENVSRGPYKYTNNKENTSHESDESGEQGDYKSKQNKSDYGQSSESSEDVSKNNDNYENSNESSESPKNKNSDTKSRDYNESLESGEINKYTSSEQPPVKTRGNSKYSQIPYSSQLANNSERIKENDHSGSSESSKEDIIESSSERYNRNTTPYLSKSHDFPYLSQRNNNHERTKENYQGDTRESSKEDISENSSERNSDNSKPYESKRIYEKETNGENHQRQPLPSSSESSNEREYEPLIHQHNSNRVHSTLGNTRDKQESSTENSSESNENALNLSQNKLNSKSALTNLIKNTSSLPIQDIDLGDFSYERININEKGNVVPLKDNPENIDGNHSVEKSHDILQLVTNIHKPLTNYSDKLIHINDGEVRPVVEINTESDEDSSERNSRNPNNFDSLGIGINSQNNENHGGNSKILKEHKNEESGDVKQQFERIPLNYNHNQKPLDNDQPKGPNTDQALKIESSPDIQDAPKEDITITKSEGTIDVFDPRNEKYDENLNFKFDDLHIKLPEIMLPDDILSFTKENSPYQEKNNQEDRNSQYHYVPHSINQHGERKDHRDNDNDNVDEDGPDDDSKYYGYYDDKSDSKQDYKKKDAEDEENDEDEDLYEKFVRERFGKRGTFEKRSERLEQRPLNPQLTETIQNILKKTANIDEQAKQSGDPNAGYMWTLEYGENL